MSTGNPTFQEKMFTEHHSNTSTGMTYYQAATKYCTHDYRINIGTWPPIYIYSDTCQLCGMSKTKSNSSGSLV
jgi:hypothetical protein